jgi:hypothetical protein
MHVPSHWAKYGFRSADVPYLKSFEATMKPLGWQQADPWQSFLASQAD